MGNGSDKVRENYARRWAKRLGLFLKKSRAKKPSVDNQGGYMLVNLNTNTIEWGEKFTLELAGVEKILDKYEKGLPLRKG
jgi:hypothetical protein